MVNKEFLQTDKTGTESQLAIQLGNLSEIRQGLGVGVKDQTNSRYKKAEDTKQNDSKEPEQASLNTTRRRLSHYNN